MTELSLTNFLHQLKIYLISILTSGKDLSPELIKMSQKYQQIKNLRKDLIAYNRVFLPEYEKFLSEFGLHLKLHLRLSNPLEKQKYIHGLRSKNYKLSRQIMSQDIKDQGFQKKDEKTGLIKREPGRSVKEYSEYIF